MTDSISKPLNASLKESLDPHVENDRSMSKDEHIMESILKEDLEKKSKRFKIISACGACFLVIGLFMCLALPAIIHSLIVKEAIDQSVLSPDNENLWAHFPGETKTIITRNYSFFNLINEEGFLLHGEKPKLREVEGYIITECEDYLNITYNDDGTIVKVRDWLHFEINNDSRSLSEEQKILNLPSISYWYILKNTRDSVVFLQGFSELFTSIEDSIKDTVIATGISSQFLPDFNTTYAVMLQPAGISLENSIFIFNDPSFGLINLQFWVNAMRTSFIENEDSFSRSALDLKDYFTLEDCELYFILTQLSEYAESLELLLFENHYCINVSCSSRELAIQQISSSFMTQNTPPVSTVEPTLTICTDNETCHGYFPELNSYYKEVYLKEHVDGNESLTFDVNTVRKWLDYNPSNVKGDYNKNFSALFHIGNLDILFGNGTLHDSTKEKESKYLINIQNQYELETLEHALVFWEWIKYLTQRFLRQGTFDNQKLGISDTFSKTLYESFSYLKDNLQNFLQVKMLVKKLKTKSCYEFIEASLQTENETTIQRICENYPNFVEKEQLQDMIDVCKWKYHESWLHFQELGATNLEMDSICDENVKDGFGFYYYEVRRELDKIYSCHQTPNSFCSDYELALKQWVNGSITTNPPSLIEDELKSETSFHSWDTNCPPFEYFHFSKKFPEKEFPSFSMTEAYSMFNFDNLFSALKNINIFKSSPETWKDYVRYVVIFIGFKGYTRSRTAKEHIFGYFDEFLLEKKNDYPPFGGDPSINAFVAFNDPNITEEEATLEVEIHTGKENHILTAQYYKINGLTYLTNNYTHFNGNETYWELETPWAERDYFYGTNGKTFAPDQPNSRNVSIYVPNIQRYGSGNMDEAIPITRHGIDVDLAFLGDYIYETSDKWPDNAKYYSKYFAVFNETSMTGAPIFMTKHHFMNCTNNWTTFVEIYNEDESIKYTETSFWDDSYVIVEPYSGASFQSTIFIQGNYLHEPDELFTYNQTLMFPIFSVYRSGNLTKETADKLFTPLLSALSTKTIFLNIGRALSILGSISATFGLYNFWKMKKKLEIEENDKMMRNSILLNSVESEEETETYHNNKTDESSKIEESLEVEKELNKNLIEE